MGATGTSSNGAQAQPHDRCWRQEIAIIQSATEANGKVRQTSSSLLYYDNARPRFVQLGLNHCLNTFKHPRLTHRSKAHDRCAFLRPLPTNLVLARFLPPSPQKPRLSRGGAQVRAQSGAEACSRLHDLLPAQRWTRLGVALPRAKQRPERVSKQREAVGTVISAASLRRLGGLHSGETPSKRSTSRSARGGKSEARVTASDRNRREGITIKDRVP